MKKCENAGFDLRNNGASNRRNKRDGDKNKKITRGSMPDDDRSEKIDNDFKRKSFENGCAEIRTSGIALKGNGAPASHTDLDMRQYYTTGLI